MAITHAFVSEKADGADETLVRPSNWNEAHVVDAAGIDVAAPAEGETGETLRLGRVNAGLVKIGNDERGVNLYGDVSTVGSLTANGGLTVNGALSVYGSITENGSQLVSYAAAPGLSVAYAAHLVFQANAPVTAGALGVPGAVAVSGNYLYICVDTNTWRRIALASW